MLTYYSFSALFNFLTSAFLGTYVFTRNRRSPLHYTYTLFAFSLAFWSFFYFLWQIETDYDRAMIWITGVVGVALYIGVTYFHFTLILLRKAKQLKKLIIAAYIIMTGFLIIDVFFRPLMITHFEPLSGFHFWPLAGPAFAPWVALWMAIVIYSSILLYREYKDQRTDQLRKSQIKLILLGMCITFIGGSTNYFLWFRIPIPPVGNIFASGYVIFSAYAILKYRFMDLRFAFRAILVKAITVFLLLVIFLAVSSVVTLVAGTLTLTVGFVGVLFLAFTAAFLYEPILSSVKLVTDRFLFQREYNQQELIRRMGKVVSESIDLNVLIQKIAEVLIQILQVEYVSFVLFSEKSRKDPRVHSFGNFHNEHLLTQGDIISYFLSSQSISIRDEIKLVMDQENVENRKNLKQLHNSMERLNAQVAVPLRSKQELEGIILLGEKKSGEAYSVVDTQILENLMFQAGTALENAQLFRHVSELNIDLEKKIQELRSLDKMKDQLVAVTSHELRTPATIVHNYLWSLINSPNPQTKIDSEDKWILARAFVGIENLIKLINDILDVSKIEGGMMEIRSQVVTVADIIKEVGADFLPKATQKGLKLLLGPVSVSIAVYADPAKLKEVLTNLFSNAIKYTAKGTVEIGIEEKDDKVFFFIRDTGKGVSEEHLSNLFKKFYREDTSYSASNPETGGTGLGLFITKSILELMHGKIWVTSEQNKGSTFFFSLPKAKIGDTERSPHSIISDGLVEGVTTREENSQNNKTKSTKKTILIIEDEAEIREFYAAFLSKYYIVVTAVDGEEGLRKLKDLPFDLVLLDIMLPKIDGVEFMRRKAKDLQASHIPVVLLTNLGDKTALLECFNLGAKAKIMKSDVVPSEIPPILNKFIH